MRENEQTTIEGPRRALAWPRIGRPVEWVSATQEVMVYCTRQRTSAIGAVVEQHQVLERQLECWLPDKCAAVMTNERDAAIFAAAALLRYQSHACQPLAMHPRMFCCCSHVLERVL